MAYSWILMKTPLLIMIFILFVSCKEDGKSPQKESGEVTETFKLEVLVGFKRTFPSGRKEIDFTKVNESLARQIVEVLKQPGETIETVPRLAPTILSIDNKEYKLYPHTIMDLAANKQ